MTDNFDSRSLGRVDCYGQRFMRPGTYRYAVGPAGAVATANELPYVVEVGEEAGKAMAQTTVMVSNDGGRFAVSDEQAVVKIALGDLVLWHSPGTSRPFAVHGDQDFFGSGRLVNESGYSHVFTSPGEFEWADAHGSGLGGVVRVKNLTCADDRQLRSWRKRIGQGTLVMISDGKAEPAEVDIVVGQSVFFAVVAGPGVSITDVALLGKHHDCEDKSGTTANTG